MTDLRPRTWRGWWLAWPKWFRIGCWGCFVLLALHVVLALRIYVGLMDSVSIQQLKSQGAQVDFLWESQEERFPGEQVLISGLLGCSSRNVSHITIENGYDHQLQLIRKEFSNLSALSFTDSDVTPAGLRTLSSCKSLTYLNLTGTNVDDKGTLELVNCKSIIELDLQGTLVTNASLQYLDQMKLDAIYLDATDITLEGQYIREYAQNRADSSSLSMLYSIHWSDEGRSSSFAYPVTIRVSGRQKFLQNEPQISFHFQSLSARTLYKQLPLTKQQFKDNKYDDLLRRGVGAVQLTLQIGDKESQPVSVLVEGNSNIGRVEFRMPCTKAEALAAVKARETAEQEE